MEEISRWPSLLENLLYAIAFYIEDPTTYFNFCISSRITNKIANNDPIFAAYKRKCLSRYITFENDIIPVLPNGLVHGIIYNEESNNSLRSRSLRFYQLGYYIYSISLRFKKTRMADTYFHKLFTQHLCITTVKYQKGICSSSVRFSSIKRDIQKREIEAYQCALCKQYHSFIAEYNNYVYTIYRDCIKDIKKCYYNKQHINHYIQYSGSIITPHDRRYSIMKSVIEYSKKNKSL